MSYWRMQLHPADSAHAIKHSIESLAAGYVGLDFYRGTEDLTKIKRERLPENQRDYWAFANEMKIGDNILIITHHFPFALATVSGAYNHIREKAPELGVWFRHFRKVKGVKYYADYVTNANSWQHITMTDTISPLRDSNSQSYKLIKEWISSV